MRFTLAASQACNSNQKQVDNTPLVFANYNGDVNQDQIIDSQDIISVFNELNNFATGYVVTDLTGDNFVDVSDIIIVYNNAHDVIGVITP